MRGSGNDMMTPLFTRANERHATLEMDARPDETSPRDDPASAARPDRLTAAALALVVLGYLAVALLLTWPLPLHLSTHLTGVPGSDTGAYVWNTWAFRRELVEIGHSPYWTTSILALDGPTNLALHNYTEFANLVTLPLQPLLGVVGSFNVVYIGNVALAGLGMFLLARRVTGRTAEAWIAGALFAAAPFLVARGSQHFSLAAAAPLPCFLYWLDRTWVDGRRRYAAAAGAAIAWAAYCDPYYAVYCVMIAALFALIRLVVVTRVVPTASSRRIATLIAGTIVLALGLVAIVHFGAGGVFTVGPITITMRTLYTPMLVLTVLAAVRFALPLRARWRWQAVPRHAVRNAAFAIAAATLLLGPELYAIGSLVAAGDLVTAPVPWRSSAPGVDLIAFFIPNPNHPWAPAFVTSWLAAEPGRYDENVVSLSLVALVVIGVAWRWSAFRPDRFWVVLTVGFAALAVGPFLRVAGVETLVPTPWTFLRYVPVIGEARMPPRFGVVVFLGVSVLFATALTALTRRHPSRRQALLLVVGTCLVIELWPAPRRLFAAEVPAVYSVIAAEPRPVRVLELPFGIRDGLSSLGDFSAASQFYQTLHGKAIIGGYLSRVDEHTKTAYRRLPVIAALLDFSEGRTPSDDVLAAARAAAGGFVTNAQLGFVVIDTVRTTGEFQRFAIEAMALERIGVSGPLELYATGLVAGRVRSD